jgi:hypothetical protein
MLNRECRPLALNLGNSAAATTGFDYRGFAGGEVYLPAGSNITQLSWYTSPDGVTYAQKYDSGNAVTSTIAAGQSCQIPLSLFGAAFLKAVVSGGNTADSSAGLSTFTLKT